MNKQPPSGGCVLKPIVAVDGDTAVIAAAFGRLCVETSQAQVLQGSVWQPPSGGCVLKLQRKF